MDYLEKLGYQPQKIRNHDYWYLSPLREEKTASFKVNRKSNAWYDQGTGKGGNMIDFGMLYHHCTIPELLEKLSTSFSFHQETPTVQQPLTNTQKLREALEPKIKVIAAKPLTNPTLCRYLTARKIPFEIAERFFKEVDFELNGKQNFAIGFENKSSGFELRNPLFKGSSSPKDVTYLEINTAKEIAVFEGFFSFLSYQNLKSKRAATDKFSCTELSCIFRKEPAINGSTRENFLYLDRDRAGVKNAEWRRRGMKNI